MHIANPGPLLNLSKVYDQHTGIQVNLCIYIARGYTGSEKEKEK